MRYLRTLKDNICLVLAGIAISFLVLLLDPSMQSIESYHRRKKWG